MRYVVYLFVFVGLAGMKCFAGEKAALSCSAEPAEVVAGQGVTLAARGMDLPSSKRLIYRWDTSGGSTTGDGASVSVDTKGLAAGPYTANVRLVDGKKLKLVASCTTTFVVEGPPPPPAPAVTCTSERAAIHAGDQVTITAAGNNPSGRALSYSYASTSGQVVGNGTSAVLSTDGGKGGGITVTCTVTDDLGRTASGKASLVVAGPVVLPKPSVRGETHADVVNLYPWEQKVVSSGGEKVVHSGRGRRHWGYRRYRRYRPRRRTGWCPCMDQRGSPRG